VRALGKGIFINIQGRVELSVFDVLGSVLYNTSQQGPFYLSHDQFSKKYSGLYLMKIESYLGTYFHKGVM